MTIIQKYTKQFYKNKHQTPSYYCVFWYHTLTHTLMIRSGHPHLDCACSLTNPIIQWNGYTIIIEKTSISHYSQTNPPLSRKICQVNDNPTTFMIYIYR